MRLIRRVIAALLLLIFAALVTGWIMLRGSLPRLDGAESLAGLNAEVTVERDTRGIPTIHASNREDLAYALGFLHAQDRFFQMDLLRREAGGELSELLGSAALPLDRETRRHRFRNRAAQTLQQFDAAEKRQLDAYVLGVNAGLAALSVRPWEYLLLRTVPRRWTREDTVLVVDSMMITLQQNDGLNERTQLAIAETYGEEVLAFLRPPVLERTAALDGSFVLAPPVPRRHLRMEF